MKFVYSYRIRILAGDAAVSTTYIQCGLLQAQNIAWDRVQILCPGERVEIHDMRRSQCRVFMVEYGAGYERKI